MYMYMYVEYHIICDICMNMIHMHTWRIQGYLNLGCEGKWGFLLLANFVWFWATSFSHSNHASIRASLQGNDITTNPLVYIILMYNSPHLMYTIMAGSNEVQPASSMLAPFKA